MSNTREKLVVLGADHNGVGLKNEVKKFLTEKGFLCIDIGPYNDAEKVDYGDYARTLGQIMHNGEARWGILICGTGVGMSIVANRFPNVRASLVHSFDVALKTREHNDANVLCLGSWINSSVENLKIVDAWISQKFGEGRHVERVEKTKAHNTEHIVFANGVFDIVHTGHLQLLKFAKSLGGKLIVGINSDRAVKIMKGNDRPINNENDRKAILENMGIVDEVIIFDDTKVVDIINQVSPNVVVKGGEWTAEEVRKRDGISQGIEVKIYPLVKDGAGDKYSTTTIINAVVKKFGKEN